MEIRFFLAVVCTGMLLFCSASAEGLSLTDLMTGGSADSGISIPALPPPESGSVLQRKVLDTQPYVFKTSARLLREAEISKDIAKSHYEESMELLTEDVNNLDSVKKKGLHYTVEEMKKNWVASAGTDRGLYSDKSRDLYYGSLDEFGDANKKYNAALAATPDMDYEQQARIFDSASEIYATLGDTKGQKQVERAALAARARAAVVNLPLPSWIVIGGILGGVFLIRRKRK